ncbi:transposase [Streptomyces sp. NPDC057908]
MLRGGLKNPVQAFPKGSLAMRIRDKLGELFSDGDFAELYSSRGKLAWSPGRLALVPVTQFTENLSDRQAADAVFGRLDWKYLLGLESTDPGVRPLSAHRVQGPADHSKRRHSTPSSCHPGRLLRHPVDLPGAQRHRRPPPNTTLAFTTPTGHEGRRHA